MRKRRLTFAALACLAAIFCASLAVHVIHRLCHDAAGHESPRDAHAGSDHSCPACEFLKVFHAVRMPFLSPAGCDRVVSYPPHPEMDIEPLRLRHPSVSPRGPPPERGR